MVVETLQRFDTASQGFANGPHGLPEGRGKKKYWGSFSIAPLLEALPSIRTKKKVVKKFYVI